MKNKFLKIFLTILFYCNSSFAEIYKFKVSNIDFKNNGNLISASNGKIKSEEKNIEIFAEKFRDNFNKRYGDHKKLELETFDQLPVLYDTTLERALVLSHPLWHNRILNVDQTNVKYQVEGIAANIKTEFVDIRAFRAAPHEQEVKFFD